MESFESVLIIIREIARRSAFQVWDLLPYVLGGIVLGELLKIKSWTRIIYKATTLHPIVSCIVASALGIASPLCTYGTIPVAISLYSAGVPLAPLISFISCSSLLNPQFIIYTFGQIGLDMAILRIATVFIVGMVFGLIVHNIPDHVLSKDKLSKARENTNDKDSGNADNCNDKNCGNDKQQMAPTACGDDEQQLATAILERKDKQLTLKQFIINCLKSLEYIAFYMLIGIIVGVSVQVLLPQQTIYELFSADKWYSVITAAIMGVPLYQCGGGVIPVIANLLFMGMGYGQALTFFLVGPATNIQSIAAIASIFKAKYVVAYVSILIALAVAIGYLYEPIHHLFA